MSGSPVYINGKLLGAISYGFPQSNGRIGMVTPISDMIRLWTINDTDQNTSDHPDTNGFVAWHDGEYVCIVHEVAGTALIKKRMSECDHVISIYIGYRPYSAQP